MSNKSDIIAAASRLWKASNNRAPCAPVRDLLGEQDLSKAYQVQLINTNLRVAAGAKLVGRKIGLTSKAVQQQLGVDQPDFGMLFDTMKIENGGIVVWDELMQPKVEAEVAFVIGQDLKGGVFEEDQLKDAIDYAVAALEIVGSRIENWDIKITDTVADNASASHFVLGMEQVPLDAIDLIGCEMVMRKQGQVVSSGRGAACLGSPLRATGWLAKTMYELGEPLKKGDIVLSGALGPMTSVLPGEQISAEISGLGSVSVNFE